MTMLLSMDAPLPSPNPVFQYMDLQSTKTNDVDPVLSVFNCVKNFCGSSTVAIDNKIEQAMDLVKSHLMYAVREEVEVLKEQIQELVEKNNQLEYENSILRASASQETLSKIQTPRQSQPPSSSTWPGHSSPWLPYADHPAQHGVSVSVKSLSVPLVRQQWKRFHAAYCTHLNN